MPSLKDKALSTESINNLVEGLNLSGLTIASARMWIVFAGDVIQNMFSQLKKCKEENVSLKNEIQGLKDKVESLNAVIARTASVDEIGTFEKHCHSLLKPQAFRSILMKVGFASVKEIPNAGNSVNLRNHGVTHNSSFGKMVFDLIKGSDINVDGDSMKKFVDNDKTQKLVWEKSVAVAAHSRLQAERNNLAKFGRDIISMMYDPSPSYKILTQPNSAVATAMWADVHRSIDEAVKNVEESSIANNTTTTEEAEAPAPEYIHFVECLAGLYSAAHFGREDSANWIKHMLPVFACVSKYRAGSSTPLACNNSHQTFMSNVNRLMGELAGRTVRDIVPDGAFEALIRMQLVKFVRYIFKDKADSLLVLLKGGSAPTPDLNHRGDMDEDEYVRGHYLALVSDKNKYSTCDIEYFIKLRQDIKDTDRRLDRKRGGNESDNEGFILAFKAPTDTAVPATPQSNRNRRRQRRTSAGITSPSGQSPTTLGAMPLLDESEDEVDLQHYPSNQVGESASV